MSLHPMTVDARGRVDLRSLDAAALRRFFVDDLGESEVRAHLVFKALWQRGVTAVDQIDDIAAATRRLLDERAYVSQLVLDRRIDAADGTTKYLWRCEDGSFIESVLIPDDDRVTLCMSSQVGCAMACSFCLTGDLGLKRHLKVSEIAAQPLQVLQDLTARGLVSGDRRPITNLVLMGMGEPLHNLDNLVPALRICLDDHALNFSHRRVTVSTVGLVPKMAELAAALPVKLAVSLNATTEEQRRQIMPITRKHSLAELLDACRSFPLPNGRRITIEYVMLAGFNDTDEDAARLFELLRDVPTKLNLIPYNENPDRTLRRPSPERVRAFQHYFVSRGVHCTVRTTRGIDVSAACGQLGKARDQAAAYGGGA